LLERISVEQCDHCLLAVRAPQRSRGHKQSDAEEFVKEALVDGPRPANEVEAEAIANGFSSRTTRRAREKLGVIAKPAGFQGRSMWMLQTSTVANSS
jgi:hypothetical protein